MWESQHSMLKVLLRLPRPQQSGEEYCETRPLSPALLLDLLFSDMVSVVACHVGDPGLILAKAWGFSPTLLQNV